MADETFEYETEIFTLTDDEGNTSEFELIGQLELKGNTYVALLPADEDGNDGENQEFVVLKLVKDENGEDTLVTIDDDDEFDDVSDAFEDEFMAEIDYDAAEGDAE